MAEYGLDVAGMRKAVETGAVEWQRHVLQRIVERGIQREEVINVLLQGELIEDYPDDYPLPSALFLGWLRKRPLHVVAAYSVDRNTAYIITAYEPAPNHFESDFKTRKQKR